jgi:RNA polymerase sigma-70 factor (ECF subfamily)
MWWFGMACASSLCLSPFLALENDTLVATACLSLERGGGDFWESYEASDEDLILRARRDDGGSAFESLLHRYEHDLFRYLRRYLGNAEMAEDVFQLTFLQVHLKRESFEDGRRFRPWLYAIATNQAIDAQRRNRRHRMVSLDHPLGHDADSGSLRQLIAGDGAAADDASEDREAAEWVRAAVDALPAPQKAVLLLVYHQGLKYREAADAIGLPVGTVKSRLHAAIRSLTRSWQHRPTPAR